MVNVRFDFTDGFNNDAVIIKFKGRILLKKSGLRTRTQISFAASEEIQVEEGDYTFEISIPEKKIKESIAVNIHSTLFIAISIEGERIKVITRDTPFIYM